MDIAYKFKAGTFIAILNEDLGLSNVFLKEKCKLWDVISIHYQEPSFWWNGRIDVITKRSMADMRKLNRKKPSPYSFVFVASQAVAVRQFYQIFFE